MKKLLPLIAVALAGVFLLAAFAPLNSRVQSINTAAIAGDTNFAGVEWVGGASKADLFYSMDQGTVNTTSLELEISADGSTWFDDPISPTILANNAADASGAVVEIPVHGWQFRIVANTTNTNTITPVLTIVMR